jgi:hypothetical protein
MIGRRTTARQALPYLAARRLRLRATRNGGYQVEAKR